MAADALFDVFAGGGELGERMRAIDWASTSLGPVETWPQSLRTCVRIILTSSQPMFVWWGDELITLYNDAYCSILAGKHPSALGKPAAEVWREIWGAVGPRAQRAMRDYQGTFDEALLLIMERSGYREETYYTFSYSPVPGDRGEPGGILCANSSDTQRIFGERQQVLLREVSAASAEARTPSEVCERSGRAISRSRRCSPSRTTRRASRPPPGSRRVIRCSRRSPSAERSPAARSRCARSPARPACPPARG